MAVQSRLGELGLRDCKRFSANPLVSMARLSIILYPGLEDFQRSSDGKQANTRLLASCRLVN